jgi:hypothetical protein
MVGRIIHYSEPAPFHKAMPGARKLVIMKRIDDDGDGFTPVAPRPAKPKNIPNAVKRETTMTYDYDTSRGPWHAMLDKMALALQAQIGCSYEQAFTKVYTDPKNAAIRDGSKYDDLAKAYDSTYGTAMSLVKTAPPAPYDPLQKAAELAEIRGPAHAKLHSMAIDHQRAHPGQSYESAYGYLYAKPENAPLREKIKSEHLAATMSGHAVAATHGDGLGKAAPADPEQDYVSPSARTPAAAEELDRLVVARMKGDPKLSYERAFTYEYLSPANRSLKDRVDSESILRAQARG